MQGNGISAARVDNFPFWSSATDWGRLRNLETHPAQFSRQLVTTHSGTTGLCTAFEAVPG